jgi:transposase
MTIPGVAELLGLTIGSRIGRISKAGPATLRWAAVEASQHAWWPNNPWHRLYEETKRRHGKSNPAKAAVARKVLIASWHVLAGRVPQLM